MVGGGSKKWTDQLAGELHKPRRVHFPRRRVHAKGIDQIWSADLGDMQAFDRYNRAVRFLQTVIDVFSKYAGVEGMKTKTGLTQ